MMVLNFMSDTLTLVCEIVSKMLITSDFRYFTSYCAGILNIQLLRFGFKVDY